MNKKKFVLLLICAIISIILTVTLAPFDDNVISYSTALNIEIALFFCFSDYCGITNYNLRKI